MVSHPLDRLGVAAVRDRRTMQFVGMLLVVLGIAAAVAWMVEQQTGWGFETLAGSLAFLAFAGCGVLLGAGMLLWSTMWTRRVVEPVLAALATAPSTLEQVEHVRRRTGHLMPPVRHQLRFHIAGERNTFNVGESDVQPILAYVRHVAPHVPIVGR